MVTNLGVVQNDKVTFCDTFPMCYLNSVTFGLLNGGGLGDALVLPDNSVDVWPVVYRFAFDFLFYVTVILLLLNIILGTIVNAFDELRNTREQIYSDITNNCFVCDMTRDLFHNSVVESFKIHMRKTHYLWNYVYFLAGLLEKDNDEQSGAETYVEGQFLKKELSWFPMKRTKQIQDKSEDMENWLGKKVAALEEKLETLVKSKGFDEDTLRRAGIIPESGDNPNNHT